MNYFRSRFQRDTYSLDSDSFLRDYRRRKNEALRQNSAPILPSPGLSRKSYSSQSSSNLEFPSPFRRETSSWLDPMASLPPPMPEIPPPPEVKRIGSSFFRSLRSLSRISSNSSTRELDDLDDPPSPEVLQVVPTDPIKIKNEEVETIHHPMFSVGGQAASILPAPPSGGSYKRRRESEIETKPSPDDDNPFTKRNFERQNTMTQQILEDSKKSKPEPPKECDTNQECDIDPLSMIEIKSALQWKAMSKRISFNFEDEPEEKVAKEECQIKEQVEPVVIVTAPVKDKRPTPRRRTRPITYSTKSVVFEHVDGFKPTTVPQLRLLCWKIKPWKLPKSNKLFSSQFAVQWNVDCDEVFPGLFIGDKASAMNISFLKKYGITHILNTAEGKEEGLVDLSQEYYGDSGITYLGFPLWDTPSCNLIPFFGCAADFIEEAIAAGGKCLVNCQMGVSRSASCAMGYLMIKQGMLAVDVMTTIRKSRDCRPNDGFLEQLVELDNDLRRHRELGLPRKLELSTFDDRYSLPNPWNFEFWTQEICTEDLGMPLVRLGEPHPLLPKSSMSSIRSSAGPSRNLSRKPSSCAGSVRTISRRSSIGRTSRRSRSASRHDSFNKNGISTTRPQSKCLSLRPPDVTSDNNNEDDWEWVWEDDEDIINDIEMKPEEKENTDKDDVGSSWTTQKLEEVKNIIEKPEEKWRVLWHQPRLTESPPSPSGSSRSFCSSRFSGNNYTSVQAGVEEDALSLVKVSSARHWKAISRKLTVNFEGMELDEAEVEGPATIPDPEPTAVVVEERPFTPTDFKPTTAQQLRLICWRVKPWDTPKDRNLFTSVLAAGWGVDCDEVHANLFIGDKASAQNTKFLQKMGITHVLNAAEGDWEGSVELNKEYYNGTGIEYLGLPLWDDINACILPYLGCASEFIASALSGNGSGKCLVNCQMGVSRSCAAAMSYMMVTQGWKAADILRSFRTRRDVRPNDAFMNQLADLDNDLRKFREHGIPRKLKLAALAEVQTLPKPWHFEFWLTIPDDLPFDLCYVGEPRTCGSNESEQEVPDNLIMTTCDSATAPNSTAANIDLPQSPPITIEASLNLSAKPHHHLLLTKLFQTSDERQEVILPSPARSRPNSYTTTVCLQVVTKSKTPDSVCLSDQSTGDESSEWDWEYYSETEDESEE